jgi:hypothetical protein
VLAPTREIFTLIWPSLGSLRDFGCCREICHPPRNLACGEKAGLQGNVALYLRGIICHISLSLLCMPQHGSSHLTIGYHHPLSSRSAHLPPKLANLLLVGNFSVWFVYLHTALLYCMLLCVQFFCLGLPLISISIPLFGPFTLVSCLHYYTDLFVFVRSKTCMWPSFIKNCCRKWYVCEILMVFY